ncbi:MAG TPA: hypothetical protein VM694_18165, partial [Polyangium sp.]|nr:hypothetical protein [Polyangium sp.]
MKKNLIVQVIVGFGLLLGSAVSAQAAPAPEGASSESTAVQPLEESVTAMAAVRCGREFTSC